MPAIFCLLSQREKIAGMARSHSIAHSYANPVIPRML